MPTYTEDYEASSSLPGGWNHGANYSVDTTAKVGGNNSLKTTATGADLAVFATQLESGAVRIRRRVRIDSAGTVSQVQLCLRLNDPDVADFGTATCYRAIVALGSGTNQVNVLKRLAGVDSQPAAWVGAINVTGFAAATIYDVDFNISAANLITLRVQRVSDSAYLQPGGTFSAGAVDCISFTDASSPITGAGYAAVRHVNAAGATVYSDDSIITGPTSVVTVDIAHNNAAWLDSPNGVDVRSDRAVIANPPNGRSIRVRGSVCTLLYDTAPWTAASIASGDRPSIAYRWGEGPWVVQQLDGTGSFAIPLPSGYVAATGEDLNLILENVRKTLGYNRWSSTSNGPPNALHITALRVESGYTISAPTTPYDDFDLDGIAYGDSNEEGHRSIPVAGVVSSEITGSSGRYSFGVMLGRALGYRMGNRAYSGSAYFSAGADGVPAFFDHNTVGNSIYLNYASSRPVASLAGLKLHVFEHGVNDGTWYADRFTAMLTDYFARIDSDAEVLVVVPFSGKWRTEITAGVTGRAEYTAGRLFLIDLGDEGQAGLYTTNNDAAPTFASLDRLHPAATRYPDLVALAVKKYQERKAELETGGGGANFAIGSNIIRGVASL